MRLLWVQLVYNDTMTAFDAQEMLRIVGKAGDKVVSLSRDFVCDTPLTVDAYDGLQPWPIGIGTEELQALFC